MNFNAAVLETLNQPLVIREVSSRALKPGQVMVKVKYSGVCRSQLMENLGMRGEDKWLPHMLGHEGVGEVVECGEGVNKVKPGDNVILTWIQCDGLDAEGAKYDSSSGHVINSGKITTFSEYTVASESRLVKKPKTIPDKVAPLFGCALPTGAGLVINELPAYSTDQVAIIGLGGIGLSALLALIAKGFNNITVFDNNPKKINLANKWGCKNSVLIEGHIDDNLINQYKNQFDYCIEAGGQIKTIEFGFEIIKNLGLLIFCSHPKHGEKISLDPHQLISGKQIRGSWGGATQLDRDIDKFEQLFSGHYEMIASLIDRLYRLDEINIALDDLSNGKVFRPILDINAKR